MREIIPFLTVKNCLEAIDYYIDIFDAKLVGEMTMMNNIKGYEDDKYLNMVGHATLMFGKSTIFLCDTTEAENHSEGNNLQLVLNFENEETLRSKFNEIAKKGSIVWELEEVFWGALFGTVKDKYGIYWQLYYGHK